MKPAPADWPRLSAALFYDDPRGAIDWLCRAFGFSVRILVEGPEGTVMHSELEYGEAMGFVELAINYANSALKPGFRPRFGNNVFDVLRPE